MGFGETLKKLRLAKGITQERLASDLDIPESTIRRLETSESIPRRDRLIQIADYFGVSIDHLLGIDEKDKDEEFNDSKTTIQLIQAEAKKLGLSPDDPIFKKMLADAFELLRTARGENSK